MNPPLSQAFYAGLYGGEYWNDRGRNLRRRISKQLDRASVISFFLRKWIEGRNNLSSLEVGAGYGGVSLGVSELNGIRATVFDPDEQALAHAKSAGLEQFQELSAEFDSNHRTFTLLMFVHVLEHQTHPRDFLLKWLRHLDNDGLVVIEVPNGQVINHFSLVHPLIFTATALRRCLMSVGIVGKIYRHSGLQNSGLPKKYLLFIGRRLQGTPLPVRGLPVMLFSRAISKLLSNGYIRTIDHKIFGRARPVIRLNRENLRQRYGM